MTTEKNYGFDLERQEKEISESDWIFGADSPVCLGQIPLVARGEYMPKGEVQKNNRDDMMDCASRGPINILEAKFTWMLHRGLINPNNREWLFENGYIVNNAVEFSDAFVAINSNTTRRGNSMKAPIHAIYEHGLVPKRSLPLESDMSWEQYHDPSRVTIQLIALGQEFLRRFTINYELVMSDTYSTLIEEDLINVAGYAWPFPKNGVYESSDKAPNHVFVLYGLPEYLAFDNYIDSVDNDFTKKLSPDYKFVGYGYRVIVSSQSDTPKPINAPLDVFQRLWNFLISLIFKTA